MSRIVSNSVSQPTQTPLRKATQHPQTNKIIEDPIFLTKKQLTLCADLELTRLQEAVVRIVSYKNGLSIGSGSAVIISPDGLAVTNKHLAESLFGYEGLTVKVTQPTDFNSGSYDSKGISSLIAFLKSLINQNFLKGSLLSLTNGGIFFRKSNTNFHIENDQRVDTNEFTAELLNIDPNSDLALIRINKNHPEHNFSFVSFEEGEVTLRAGDESYSLGHPAGTPFNVLRRAEVIDPIGDLSNSIFQIQNNNYAKKISVLNSEEKSQLDRCRSSLLNSLLEEKQNHISLAVNCPLDHGDSGGLQANPEGKLRGINTQRYQLTPEELALLGISHYNLSKLRMLSLAVPAQNVLDLCTKAGVSINSLLRGEEVGVTKMQKIKPPKSSNPK